MPLRGDRLRWPPRLSRRQTGTRQTLSTDEQSPAPRQPNEKDLSTDAQAGPPRKVIEQARRDLEQGLQDTDLRNRAREVIEEAGGKK